MSYYKVMYLTLSDLTRVVALFFQDLVELDLMYIRELVF